MKEKIRSTRLRMCFRKMPLAVCFLTLFALCFGALSVRAADPSGRVALTAVRMQRAGGQVYVSFAVKIAPRAVRARHRWVITPCLGNASDSVLLGPFVVTGRIMAREEISGAYWPAFRTVTSIIGGPPAMETPSCIPIRCAMPRGWRMA